METKFEFSLGSQPYQTEPILDNAPGKFPWNAKIPGDVRQLEEWLFLSWLGLNTIRNQDEDQEQ